MGGINYLETQPLDGTNVTQVSSDPVTQSQAEHYLTSMGGENSSAMAGYLEPEQKNIVPHVRTLRNAREQVKQMVIDGISARRIKRYLSRWCSWWVKSSQSWQYQELLEWFLHVCRDVKTGAYAAELLHETMFKTRSILPPAGLDFHAIA